MNDPIKQALEALDDLDDYARMETGVDAHGPVKVLRDFINSHATDAALVQPDPDRWEWGMRRIVALLWGNRKSFEIDEVVAAVRENLADPYTGSEAKVVAEQERALDRTTPKP